jgi:hypothetical protein
MKTSVTFKSLALLGITILLAGCGLGRVTPTATTPSTTTTTKREVKDFPCPVTQADAEGILRTPVKQIGLTGHVENSDSKITQSSCTYSGVSKDSLNPIEMPDVDVGLVVQITTTPNAKESFAALKQGPVTPVIGIGDEAAQDTTEPGSDPKKFSMANLHVLKNSTIIEFQVMAPTAKGGSSEALKSVAQKVADQY